MKRLIIKGNKKLSGVIDISGAKNSAVALIPAAILCDEEATVLNVPNISDVSALNEILTFLGAEVSLKEDIMKIDSKSIDNKPIPENIAKKLRASYYFMGALLGKYKKVSMFFPGGCNIGTRPINLHLKGFEALGATIIEKDNHYDIFAEKLRGARIYLDIASVGATINIMLAAVRAEGETVIENAAKEPEIVNVATFLNNMGAKITGAGTSVIKITGVNHLKSCFHEVIPDRIEAGTYLILASAIGENLTITNIIHDHLEALVSKLKEMGVKISKDDNSYTITASDNLKAINIKTLGYPGYPTDLQQPLTALLTKCNGRSLVEETIYENRFQNLSYLEKMGAKTEVNGSVAKIYGPTKLVGQEVVATDLRAGACLVIAGLMAEGKTTINDCEHILRGYENIVQKLNKVGADIVIEEIN